MEDDIATVTALLLQANEDLTPEMAISIATELETSTDDEACIALVQMALAF